MLVILHEFVLDDVRLGKQANHRSQAILVGLPSDGENVVHDFFLYRTHVVVIELVRVHGQIFVGMVDTKVVLLSVS